MDMLEVEMVPLLLLYMISTAGDLKETFMVVLWEGTMLISLLLIITQSEYEVSEW